MESGRPNGRPTGIIGDWYRAEWLKRFSWRILPHAKTDVGSCFCRLSCRHLDSRGVAREPWLRGRRLRPSDSEDLTMASVSFNRLCLAALGCWAVAATSTACSEGSDDSSGTGGTSTTGGTTSTGGDTGGTTGSGGTASTSVLDNPTTLLYGFTLGTDGMQAANLTPTAVDITAQATLTHDPADNAPCTADKVGVGSIKIEAPFNAYGTQRVDYQFLLTAATDFANKSLYLWLKWDSGFNPDASAPGGIIFYGKSTGFVWGQAPWKNLERTTLGQWQPIKFDLANPDLNQTTIIDPTQVVAIGFQLNTGGTEGLPEGTGAALPTAAVFHVDCVGWSPNP
jgi:hypothetical protein